LNDLKIATNHFYNQTDYYSIEKESFMLKFLKQKEIVVNVQDKNGKLISKNIKSNCKLTVKFRKGNHIQLNQNDINFLKNYAKK
jgi:hypothetical protein